MHFWNIYSKKNIEQKQTLLHTEMWCKIICKHRVAQRAALSCKHSDVWLQRNNMASVWNTQHKMFFSRFKDEWAPACVSPLSMSSQTPSEPLWVRLAPSLDWIWTRGVLRPHKSWMLTCPSADLSAAALLHGAQIQSANYSTVIWKLNWTLHWGAGLQVTVTTSYSNS